MQTNQKQNKTTLPEAKKREKNSMTKYQSFIPSSTVCAGDIGSWIGEEKGGQGSQCFWIIVSYTPVF